MYMLLFLVPIEAVEIFNGLRNELLIMFAAAWRRYSGGQENILPSVPNDSGALWTTASMGFRPRQEMAKHFQKDPIYS